jgi:hypothetical protein
MPSLKELLTQHNVTLPDGVNLADLVEQSDEVRGLKTTKDELLNWKVTNKPLLESLAAEKNLLATKAKEEEEKALRLAQENGDFKTTAEITAKRLKSLEDGLNASREETRSTAERELRAQVAAKFGGSKLGSLFAKDSVKVKLGDDGKLITELNIDGSPVDGGIDDLLAAAAKVPDYANMMPVGGESNTPAANGQGSGGGAQPNQQPKLSSATKNYLASIQN